MKMPMDPPLVDPIGQKPLGQGEEEDSTLKAADLMTDNWPPH